MRLLPLLLLLSACAAVQHAPAARVSQQTYGQRLAQTHCASCHAIGAEGESRHPMAPPLRTLSRAYPVASLEEAFAEGILVGHPDMPEFRLEPEEIDALVDYLQGIQERSRS